MTVPLRLEDLLTPEIINSVAKKYFVGQNNVGNPTPRDATQTDRKGQGVTDLHALFSMLPAMGKAGVEMFTPVGNVTSAWDAGKNLSEGNYGMAGLAALGAIPFIGSTGRVAEEAARLSPAMAHLSKYFKPSEAEKILAAKLEAQLALRSRGPHPLEGKVEGIPVHHSSGAVFLEPDPSIFGTGAGDQWQGWGTYLAGSPEVAKYYRGITEKVLEDHRLLGKSINKEAFDQIRFKSVGEPSSKELSYITLMDLIRKPLNAQVTRDASFTRDAYQDTYNMLKNSNARRAITMKEAKKQLEAGEITNAEFIRRLDKKWNDRHNRTMRIRLDELSQRQSDLNSTVKTTGFLAPKLANTYSGKFFANPDELLNLEKPLQDQASSEKIRAALNEFQSGAGNPVGDLLLKAQFGHPMQAYGHNQYLLQNGYEGYSPEQIAKALLSKGVVGNKYLNRNARGMMESLVTNGNIKPDEYYKALDTKASDTRNWNFVSADPSRIHFTDLKSWLAAALLGGGAASVNNKKDR